MKITIESTSKIVEIQTNTGKIPARIWQGSTESGVPVQCFISLVSPKIPEFDSRIDELTAEFERDLQRYPEPRPTVDAIPLHLILG